MDIIDLIFPRKCFGCGKEGSYICSSCLSKLENLKPICPMCERPSTDGMTHVGCKKPLGLDGLISIWNYEGAVRKAIISLKYKFAFDIAKELASHIKLASQGLALQVHFVLVPIPLYWHRENWRGFNQSEELGKIVAKKMGWQFMHNLLIRKKQTQPQADLDAQKRSQNIQGVFALNSNYSSTDLLIHSSIILFDDVWTTGSTLKEACKVLKRVGIKKVWGLTLAR